MKKLIRVVYWAITTVVVAGIPALAQQTGPNTVYLDELDTDLIEVGWRVASKNKNMEGNPLTLSGKTYARGICTHARTTGILKLDGKANSFTAVVGLDDAMAGRSFGSSVAMAIYRDGVLALADTFKPGQGGKPISITLDGAKQLLLSLSGIDGNTNHSHFDWADAIITYSGEKPAFYQRAREPEYILTPSPGPKPVITSAKVFGVRPGSPILFKVSAIGQKPMRYSATGLPAGVTLDASTGRLSGRISAAGDYAVAITAENAKGNASGILRIKCGDKIALTPPMGWNSWNAWGMTISPEKVRAAADGLVSTGLIDHGWSYVNIDDGWQGKREGAQMGLQPDERFRDMKGLADYVHNKGLRFGLYSTPWVTSYGNRVGGSMDREDGFRYNAEGNKGRRLGVYPMHKADAALFGQWGIDYLKYDWAPVDVPHTMVMADALKGTGRDIVFSLSNSVDFKQVAEWKKYAHVWRTTGDIIDTWGSLEDIGFSQDRWSPFAEPGNWNDPDMLILGHLGWGDKIHPTRLTPNEQYTHMTQWCMLAAPLLLGCDLTKLDAFTLNLLTNHEVIAVNQDPLGKQARKVYDKDLVQVWSKPLEDGSAAIAIYNLSMVDKEVSLPLASVGLGEKVSLRDLWRQKEVGTVSKLLPKVLVPIHGCYLYKVQSVK